jgi:hypothetical protein
MGEQSGLVRYAWLDLVHGPIPHILEFLFLQPLEKKQRRL